MGKSESQDHLYREIGARVRRARLKRGMKQVDLAARVDLTRVSIVNVERGRQRLPIHTVYAIAGVLAVRPLDLLPDSMNREGDPTADELVQDFTGSRGEEDSRDADKDGGQKPGKEASPRSRRGKPTGSR